MQNITRYQDKYFLYIWKPANIPTTFGKKQSFLEQLLENGDPEIVALFKRQQQFFGPEEEYGLLNRLDTPTSGLLTFAKTPLFAQRYKQLQASMQIEKIYLAEVSGKFSIPPGQQIVISSPIAHSKTSNIRMLVLDPQLSDKKLKQLEKKAKKRRHNVKTFCTLLYYNPISDTSILEITIHKGIRHQIRAHLSSIGHPIIGDTLYGNQKDNRINLQLYCLGIHIEK